jgi:hypothetical protein
MKRQTLFRRLKRSKANRRLAHPIFWRDSYNQRNIVEYLRAVAQILFTEDHKEHEDRSFEEELTKENGG